MKRFLEYAENESVNFPPKKENLEKMKFKYVGPYTNIRRKLG
jgi:hypothetical protein